MRIFPAILVLLTMISPQAGVAGESRFSAMVSDIDTGLILTADRIDAPRDVGLIGRLLTIATALQGIAEKTLHPDDMIPVSADHKMPLLQAVKDSATGKDGYRAALTGLANRVGKSVSGYTDALAATENEAGLRGTALKVVRSKDGGPGFEGYTTPRDISRIATSMLRSYPEQTQDVFSDSTGGWAAADLWIAQDCICAFAGRGPESKRTLLAVLTGAPDADTCLEKAVAMIARDDHRIMQAKYRKKPGY